MRQVLRTRNDLSVAADHVCKFLVDYKKKVLGSVNAFSLWANILHGLRSGPFPNSRFKINEIKGPGEMDFTCPNNVSEMWPCWRRGMEHFLAATYSLKSEGKRVAIFACMISKDGQEVKDTFEFQTAEDGTDIVSTAGTGSLERKAQNTWHFWSSGRK